MNFIRDVLLECLAADQKTMLAALQLVKLLNLTTCSSKALEGLAILWYSKF